MDDVLYKKKKNDNDTRIVIQIFWKLGYLRLPERICSAQKFHHSRNSVGKFRERVSNRFGTEDDDRSGLSPVSLATCKPNCVTWSETETERSWAREGKERNGRRFSRFVVGLLRSTDVARRFNDPTCGYPFLRAHPVFDYTVADIARPVTR